MSTAAQNLAKLRDMFLKGSTPRQLAEEALRELEALPETPCSTWPYPTIRAGSVSGANCAQDAPGAAPDYPADSEPLPEWVNAHSAKRHNKKKRK